MNETKKKRPAPPRYDEEFKTGAMRMVTEQNRPARQVANELGICYETLKNWLKQSGVGRSPCETNSRIKELEAEVRALKKSIAEKDESLDVLKKSMGIIMKT